MLEIWIISVSKKEVVIKEQSVAKKRVEKGKPIIWPSTLIVLDFNKERAALAKVSRPICSFG